MARVVRPGGVLLLGATESLREFSDDFEIFYRHNATINVRRRDRP
jgi:chemotaxis methyl-accepting protein methylase